MADIEMVVIDGVRYRAEDVPDQADAKKVTPQNKARKPVNKSGAEPDDEKGGQ